MLNGGGEKIKWKLEMIYNARKNHESGLYGDKLTFLNLIYQGWDRDVLFWCIIMGRQVSEMRGEMLKYVPKKVLYIFHWANSHLCMLAWGNTLLEPVRAKGSSDSWHHRPPQWGSWHFVIDESNLGPGGLVEGFSALGPASGETYNTKKCWHPQTQCFQIHAGIQTHRRESTALAFHTLCLLPICSRLTHMCCHLLKLPKSQVKSLLQGEFLIFLLHCATARGVINWYFMCCQFATPFIYGETHFLFE